MTSTEPEREPIRVKRVATYDCGHTFYFHAPYPCIGDVLFCQRCRKDAKVIHAPHEWRIVCMDCRYSKSFGEARINAEIAVGKHRQRRFHHRVKLLNGDTHVRTFENRDQNVIPELF